MPLLHDEEVAPSRSAPAAATLSSLPILILNVHTNCNCRCIMCDIWKRQAHEQITVADLNRHRSSLRHLGVRQVVLTGGEPLLHADLRALCEFFRELGIRLTLLTTGLLLSKRADEVASSFDDVIVSIDGPRAVHDGIRRVRGGFDVIAKGVEAILALQPRIPIACRTTVQKANHLHLCATVAAAKTIGLSSVSFLAADLTSEAFNRPLVWIGDRQNEIALNGGEVLAFEGEMERLIAEHEADIRARYIVESPDKLRRIVRRFREHLGQASPESPVCNAPWISTVVEVDGSVRPCFFHRSIGSIAHGTLEEIVNGEAARQFRESLSVAENPTCRRCVCSLNYRQ